MPKIERSPINFNPLSKTMNISFETFLFNLKEVLFICFVLWLFQAWFQFYTLNCGVKRVLVEKLKEGIEIPREKENEVIIKILNKKERKIKLSKKDIEKIKEHFKGKTVIIYTTFPFAPFLFVSVLITIWQTFKFW